MKNFKMKNSKMKNSKMKNSKMKNLNKIMPKNNQSLFKTNEELCPL